MAEGFADALLAYTYHKPTVGPETFRLNKHGKEKEKKSGICLDCRAHVCRDHRSDSRIEHQTLYGLQESGDFADLA